LKQKSAQIKFTKKIHKNLFCFRKTSRNIPRLLIRNLFDSQSISAQMGREEDEGFFPIFFLENKLLDLSTEQKIQSEREEQI